jgi:formate hydrogenlyase subunit 6/NADH:ubiquinone oxidoreductase subunit I
LCRIGQALALCCAQAGDVIDPQLYINPNDCIDCTLCVDACPVTAIFAEEDLPDEWSSYTDLNKKFFESAP